MVDSTSLPQTSHPGIRLAGEHLEPGHVAHEPHQPLAYLVGLPAVPAAGAPR